MEQPLTPRERFRLTLAHQQPDRPPIQTWLTPEIHHALQSHAKQHWSGRSIEEMFEIDFRYVGPRQVHPVPELEQLHNDSGVYQDVVARPLAWIQSTADVARYKPSCDPDNFDFSVMPQACAAALPYVRVLGNPGLFDLVNGLGARGRGLENMICDIFVEDPVAVALIDRHLEFTYEYFRRGLEAAQGQVDLVHIGEDCGSQNGPLFPPAFFRRFFVPRLKPFVDLAHRHGAACMLHSCGSIRDLLPILIDEVGLDIQDACQPEAHGMEPAGLKRDFGGRITFCGMLSLQRTLSRGTVEECRNEARRLIDVAGRDGGYIFAPANTITRDTPLGNVLAVYEVVTGKDLQ